MAIQATRSEPVQRKKKPQVNAAFAYSAAAAIGLHALLGLVIGGIVIFEGEIPNIFFDGTDVLIEQVDAPPLLEDQMLPEAETLPELQETVADAGQQGTAEDSIDLSDLIVSSAQAISSSFSMPKTVGNSALPTSALGLLSRGSGNGKRGPGSGILTSFGYQGQVEGTLKGSLFDTKQDPKGKALITPAQLNDRQFLIDRMSQISKEFTSGEWNQRDLEKKYFKAEIELYSSFWIIGKVPAEEAPKAFGIEDQVEAKSILAHYEGTFTPEESGEFRFLAKADDIIVVRVAGEVVVDGSYYNNGSNWKGATGKGPNYLLGLSGYPPNFGNWMNWEAGKTLEMNVLIGESPGGVFGCCLLYQKKGEEKLRVFSTKPLTSKERKNLKDISPEIENWL